MNLKFHIDYKTVFGEELVLNLAETAKDGSQKSAQYRMATADGEHWTCNVKTTSPVAQKVLNYYYSVEAEGQQRRHEWTTMPHQQELNATRGKNYEFFDRWTDIPDDAYLYTSAFTDCVNLRTLSQPQAHNFGRTVRLIVRAPQLKRNHRLVMVGAEDALGAWNLTHAVEMTEHAHNEWLVDLSTDSFVNGKIEFKFVALDRAAFESPIWENGENRELTLPDNLSVGDIIAIQLEQATFPVPNVKIAGTLVPVFSLRTEGSFGVGDFGDLKQMVEWAAHTHQRLLQILPINDTTTTHTWTDSYPYSCISIFALHPQYADLRQLPEISDAETRQNYELLRKELNSFDKIDYERVNNAKIEYLRAIYKQEGKQILAKPEYKKFFAETEHWLVPYAQYCHLRDTYGTAEFAKWPDHNTWDEKERAHLTNPRTKAYKELEFYFFVQFILSEQLSAVHAYARSKGVILKGDIPIGVSRYGCDVWMEPNYFNMNGQAGAPPDDFSVKGQNWGFPTYNWDAMIADGCQWWVRRFQNMAKYFDAYRIDHVLGFFRIWEIPIESVHGLLGQFSPALAMTREEIEAYGLNFQEDLFTRPFIADWTLNYMFGGYAEKVKEMFLQHSHDDIWELRPEFDTQRKIETYFADSKNTEALSWHDNPDNLKEGLYALVSNVLFVRDRKDPNRFHPRITAQLDFMYEALWDMDKDAFNRIYNDYYYRRNNQFWYSEAMKKLPKLVEATRMLVCAEDLGMVPDCVQWVMQELRILSLELQSMPKDPTVRFGHLSRNPYRSVCTVSSHDMPTLRMWWDEDIERTQDYYNSMLYHNGAAPHPLSGSLAREILERQLESPSMLCILAIQDWLAIDERIRLADENAERVNIPANPKHYWRYRMHLSIEELMANKDFTANIRDLVDKGGRK